MGILAFQDHEYTFPVAVGSLRLPGFLTLPNNARGVVIFAHGSGSSRFSERNRMIAESLRHVGVGSLLFDLLTQEEEWDRRNVFDIELLAERLDDAKNWVRQYPDAIGLPIGYFGASTGAAAAIVAAANAPVDIRAVVSRGGRPDLAAQALGVLKAPTLLIVGGGDSYVVELNRNAFEQMKSCQNRALEIVTCATHLFPEPGALAKVSELANHWFETYL